MTDMLSQAHTAGRSALTNISIAQDCPQLRLQYLRCAARAAAQLSSEIDAAIAAESDDALSSRKESIRCNDCHEPENCPQCIALNEERKARFGK